MSSVYSVTQISRYIRNLFARDFCLRTVTIRGEISNCKYHTAGHIYFTLKDENAALSGLMFASDRAGLSFQLTDGQQVDITGQISLYEKTGACQLYAKKIVLSGRGELYEKFLRLRSELEEMGMFDPGYKKPIPAYAQKIGIVTSETGAAIRDIVNIAGRRNPYTRLYLMPALVQGENAAASIARAIRAIDRMGMDVLIVGRGGGSFEDLFAFNEEIVAHAVFDCHTPVISAVGHETDFSICDFVADLRAPTPSAAAELATFDLEKFDEQLLLCRERMQSIVAEKAESRRLQLKALNAGLQKASPGARLLRFREGCAAYRRQMLSAVSGKTEKCLQIQKNLSYRLQREMEISLEQSKKKLQYAAGRLDAASPLKKMSGGYGYLLGPKGTVKSIHDLTEGDKLKIYLRDGRVLASVTDTEPAEVPGKDHTDD